MTDSCLDIIPPDWRNWSASTPTVVKPLDGGLTNRSFLLEAGDDLLVLRINSAISASLDLNRTAEHQALLRANNAGICAPLIYCDPQQQYLVTRYLPGGPWDMGSAGALRRLARLVRSIHALPDIDAKLDINAKAANYWQSIDDRADFTPALRALAQEVQWHITAAGALSRGARLCHNDLLITNLIAASGGNLYAIDWEYAAMGDPFYDLAVIVEEHGLDTAQQQLLLSEYLNEPVAAIDRQRLDHWRVIYGYLCALWYAVQWSTGAMAEPGIKAKIGNKARNLSALSSAVRG
ncbi:choline kinase family protein [Microbulbifer magnicolonia]|uniref:choline kinase family protein n=1 Tax=Microbulbifer magnicolonia TaxID=3109744 RepID=UPI002B41863C|nr:choline kinase family protein [Microbulbifer sp. GG15]